MSQLFFNPHRIKAERIARNLSQEEVATKLGKDGLAKQGCKWKAKPKKWLDDY